MGLLTRAINRKPISKGSHKSTLIA